jgi:Holliday junction resolvase
MKLAKKPSAEKEKAVCSPVELKSRAGRKSRNKGALFERKIAKLLEAAWGIKLTRTPQSGGFRKDVETFRGDIVPADGNIRMRFHFELKNQKTWSLPQWIRQAESDCAQGKIPVVVFHRHESAEDYVCLSLDDFLKVAKREDAIT